MHTNAFALLLVTTSESSCLWFPELRICTCTYFIHTAKESAINYRETSINYTQYMERLSREYAEGLFRKCNKELIQIKYCGVLKNESDEQNRCISRTQFYK
jgi:hypothetical protein